MSTIIDADTAKLAGLQIDLLQKVRQGHVTLSQLEWFNMLKPETRKDILAGRLLIAPPPKPPPPPEGQLVWVHSLGMLFVPDGYKHETRLTDFLPVFKNKREICTVTPSDMRDENHANVSTRLSPWQAYNVEAYMWVGPRIELSKYICQLKKMPANIFLGAQGATLVLEHMCSRMIADRPYVSLDALEKLAWCCGSFCGRGAATIMRSDRGGDGEDRWQLFFKQVNALASGGEFILCFKDPKV